MTGTKNLPATVFAVELDVLYLRPVPDCSGGRFAMSCKSYVPEKRDKSNVIANISVRIFFTPYIFRGITRRTAGSPEEK